MASVDLDRVRLAQVFGMLGSSQSGERAAAALQAERLRREAGLTWFEIVAPPASTRTFSRRADIESTADAIAFCLAWPDALTPWEWDFLQSISRRARLSDKQLDVLIKLVGNCRAAEAMATS
jgi:hypothetical protein